MSETVESIYQSLQEDIEIGPEHHRFRLVKYNSNHPLGQMWQAEDISTAGNPLVTLLIINPAISQNEALADDIKTHAALNKQLKKSHIAECYGFFVHKAELLFLSYEKLDGITLTTVGQREQPLPEAQKLGLIKQIAYAIDMGFQKIREPHACLSPSIIFINRKGGVKLTLFSLYNCIKSAAEILDFPLEHIAYQSPECFKSEKLVRQTDVYAFACILYEIFTGNAPFKHDDPESSRSDNSIPQPDSLNDNQWQALQKAMSVEPSERFPNCTELVKTLFPVEEDEPEETKQNSTKQNNKGANTNSSDKTNASTNTSDTEKDGEDSNDKPAKFSISILKEKFFNIPTIIRYSIIGLGIFVFGWIAGWLATTFFNYQKMDLQKLQITKQQEALGQLFTSLQAQQTLGEKQKQTIEQQEFDISVLKQKLGIAERKLDAIEPDKPGNQIFKDQINKTHYGPEMVLLPSGQFRMGDIQGTGEDNEKPVRLVYIDKSFALSRYEITFAEYDLFAKQTSRALPKDNGWGRGNHPVTNISWADAKAYAEWLSSKSGRPYRLPTEAEWEYAARAGSTTSFWWGNDLQSNMTVCKDCGSQWDNQKPANVGRFAANNWGLHEMEGNVSEWVADCYATDYTNVPSDGSAFRSNDCSHRITRGGSWSSSNQFIRSSARKEQLPDLKANFIGFRVALDM